MSVLTLSHERWVDAYVTYTGPAITISINFRFFRRTKYNLTWSFDSIAELHSNIDEIVNVVYMLLRARIPRRHVTREVEELRAFLEDIHEISSSSSSVSSTSSEEPAAESSTAATASSTAATESSAAATASSTAAAESSAVATESSAEASS